MTGLIQTIDACALLGVSRRTFDQHTKHLPGFPKPLILSPRVIRWDAEAIRRWVAAQVKAA